MNRKIASLAVSVAFLMVSENAADTPSTTPLGSLLNSPAVRQLLVDLVKHDAGSRAQFPDADCQVARVLLAQNDTRIAAAAARQVSDPAFASVVSAHFRALSPAEQAQVAAIANLPDGEKALDALSRILRGAAAETGRTIAATLTTGREDDQAERIRKTAGDMLRIASALEARAQRRRDEDENPALEPEHPVVASLQELERHLYPKFITDMPTVDAWANPFAILVRQNGRSYRLMSGGPDGKIDELILRGEMPASETDDLVIEDGAWLAAPTLILAEPEL